MGAAEPDRYGRLTVVPSPLAETVNTPVLVLEARAYAVQPEGDAGTLAMKGGREPNKDAEKNGDKDSDDRDKNSSPR